jgi:geranylgeranyl diphosphate synthase type II
LLAYWKLLSQEVDYFLASELDQLTNQCPQKLSDALRYSLLAPGKRLRPVLCILTCEALGGHKSLAMHNAAALEMIHCYSLIHDDLPAMDDDDLRRGRPTCHIQFDEATAILAGDALQAQAFRTMTKSELSSERIVECCAVLAEAAGPEGMVGGQMDDLLAESQIGNADVLMAIHSRKTGAMIRASVSLGAISAGASEPERCQLSEYGARIGIAFQIADDLLDVEGTQENTGKRTGKDMQRGKLTYPSFWGVEESRRKANQYVSDAIDLIRGYGEASVPLQQLARYIVERSQ